jgi:hypothetical protein
MKSDKKRKNMKEKKVSKKSPDNLLKQVEEQNTDELPKIFKFAKRSAENSHGRREFIKGVVGAVGVGSIAEILLGCGKSEYSILSDSKGCTCHVVCACDVQKNDESNISNSEQTSQYDDSICTCDTVCTCHTVCTCNTVSNCTCDSESCSCDSDSGYSYSYYYTYWYPN